MTNDKGSNVSGGYRQAAEAAERARKAAEEAERIVGDAKKATGSLEKTTLKADIMRKVTNLANIAAREAKAARHASDRAKERAKAMVADPNNAESALAATREADEAAEAADRAEAFSKEADEARKEAVSNYVVEEQLKVKEFFNNHKPQIYRKLEECYQIAQNAPTNRDMIFIAESLPIINSIINVGSDRKTLIDASRWVRETWGDEADPLIVLSALLFIYVANQGAEEMWEGQGDPEEEDDRREIWRGIHERVQKLFK